VSTTSPNPPSPAPSTPPAPPGGPVLRVRSGSSRTRILAGGALAIVVLVIAYLLFAGSGSGTYQLLFSDAGQLVRGDQVQVGGVPVGSIKDIKLTSDYKARVTIVVNSSLVPLHEGTTAEIRDPSLSGVANRYVALTPGPNNRPKLAEGATLSGASVHGIVDLDQLFGIFNKKTRTGLTNVIRGFSEQYAGASKQVNVGAEYFSPSLAAADHIFAELTRDQQTFTSFLVNSAKALTTIAAHKEQLTSLVGNGDVAFGAIGAEQTSLAEGLKELPGTLEQGNHTFAELPSTLDALRKLVDVSKPDTKTLAPFFARLQPLLSTATPVLHNLSLAIDRSGADNDLTDATLALPGLAQALSSGSSHDITALQESVPITSFFGPYAPDLQGFVRDFGQGGAYYDANGHYARVSPVFDGFTVGANDTLTPAASPAQGLQGLLTGQLRRCPGAGATPPADGSAPFTDGGQLSCDPSEVP
jgi:phospholipid/cholesterol/gamma-HCH transport system substrate-binding protein